MNEEEYSLIIKEIMWSVVKYVSIFLVVIFLGVLFCQMALAWEFTGHFDLPFNKHGQGYNLNDRYQFDQPDILNKNLLEKQNAKRIESYNHHKQSDSKR